MIRRFLAILLLLPLLLAQQCLEPLPYSSGTALPTASPRITLNTNMGAIVIELFPQQAEVAGLFQQYFEQGYYDSTVFHEINQGTSGTTWIAGGKYRTSLTVKPARVVSNQSGNGLKNRRGRVALYTPVDQSTATPHFLINLTDNASLDYSGSPVDYTVAGRVVDGMSVADAIGQVPTSSRSVQDETLNALPDTPVTVNDPTFTASDYTDPNDDAEEDENGNPIDHKPPDLTKPIVTITSPTAESTFTSTASTIDIAGTASDDVGVVQVTWSNDKGGEGTCTGTANWSASGIALQTGQNVITVTATDADNNTGTDTLTVNVQVPSEQTAKLSAFSSYSPAAGAVGVVLTKVDKDNSLDMAVACRDASLVLPLLNSGSGTFTAEDQSLQPRLNGGPLAVIATDFNGDGVADLATVDTNNKLTILLNSFLDNGQFGSFTDYDVGTGPAALVAGRFGLDPNNVWLAVANTGSNDVSVFSGDGSGSLTPGGTYSIVPPSGSAQAPVAMITADVEGNGSPDLVTANRDTNNLSILTNDGIGQFTATSVLSIQPDTSPSALVAADFDGDGDVDLAVATYDSKHVIIFLNDGHGGFTKSDTPLVVGHGAVSIAAGKLNQDDIPDLVVANSDDGTVSVLIGNGDGTFKDAVTFLAGVRPVAVAVGDLNGDGLDDVVTTNFDDGVTDVPVTNAVHVMLNITGQSGNSSPIPNPGPRRRFVATGSSVVLDGSGSSDPDGDALTYSWKTTAGTIPLLAGSDQVQASFTAPATPTDLTFELAVTDTAGDKQTRSIIISVLQDPKVTLDTSMGTVVLDVLLKDTPITSDNFLRYVHTKFYNGIIFQRVVPDFVVQGGGYLPGLVRKTGVGDPILNEFSPDRSNVRGTVAMAKRGNDPNSATCQFFFNLADNSSNLDSQNGGFTVFARAAEGMDVVDAMAAVATETRNDPAGNPFENVPVTDIVINTATIEP